MPTHRISFKFLFPWQPCRIAAEHHMGRIWYVCERSDHNPLDCTIHGGVTIDVSAGFGSNGQHFELGGYSYTINFNDQTILMQYQYVPSPSPTPSNYVLLSDGMFKHLRLGLDLNVCFLALGQVIKPKH